MQTVDKNVYKIYMKKFQILSIIDVDRFLSVSINITE